MHENAFCSAANSPHKVSILEKQNNCNHTKTEMVGRYIPGEAVMEPDYDLCLNCNKHL